MGESSQRQAQRAERILDAAADLFAHYGFDKTTMDDIAQAAHVSKGAIYLHFRGKEDLFDALILRENDLLQEEMMRRLEADGDRLTVFSMYRHSVEASLSRPLMRALMTSDHRVLGDFIHRIKDTPAYHIAANVGVEWVQNLQQAGMIRPDVAPESLAAVLMAVKYGYLSLPDLVANPPPPEVTGEVIADMLQRAFGTDYGNSEAGREVMRQLFERGREFLKAMRAQRATAAPPD
ncbi:MAG: helix-turn-helix domain-containing protein [Anaerolineae bacterium]